jgi:hypothetical protein
LIFDQNAFKVQIIKEAYIHPFNADTALQVA